MGRIRDTGKEHDVIFLELDPEDGSITELGGITYDKEDRESLGTHLIEEFTESDDDIAWIRDNDLETDYEIIKS